MKKNELALQSLYEQIQEMNTAEDTGESNGALQESTLVEDN